LVAKERSEVRETADREIRKALLAAYVRDGRLASQLICIEICGSLVTLSGTVQTRDAAWAAIYIAARMPLLRGIINRIQVKSAPDSRGNTIAAVRAGTTDRRSGPASERS
jgi:osmotically-inducible protein OsmY